MTIVVQPLSALVAETAQALKAQGIKHQVYRTGESVEKWVRVVVCTTDAASEEIFYAELDGRQVNRVILATGRSPVALRDRTLRTLFGVCVRVKSPVARRSEFTYANPE